MTRFASPFLVIRGLDKIRVLELKTEYEELFQSTGHPIHQERAEFLSRLYPLVIDSFDQTPEEASIVKQKVKKMMEREM